LKVTREDVIFIYPKKYKPDTFPAIILQYQPGEESLSDMFDKYCSKYFNYAILMNYRLQFYKGQIRSYINFQKISMTESRHFESHGPLELIVNFGRANLKYKISGSLIFPPMLYQEKCTIDIYFKGLALKKIE